MTKTTENTEKLLNSISEMFENGDINNENIVQLIELAGGYLNLKTIPKYAKDSGKSYNGVKYHRKIVNLFGVKFVIDNE